MPKLTVAQIGEDGEMVPVEIDTEAKPEPVERYTGMEDLIAALQAGEDVPDDWVIREVELERRAAETMEQRAVIPPLVAARWRAVTARLSAAKARDCKATKQKSAAGRVSKRRVWADPLADYLAGRCSAFADAWQQIPDSSSPPLELDGFERDLAYYRDGERVICIDANTQAEVGSLARSTFETTYFRPARKRAEE